MVIRWWQAQMALEADEPVKAAEYLLSQSHGESLTTDPWATSSLTSRKSSAFTTRRARTTSTSRSPGATPIPSFSPWSRGPDRLRPACAAFAASSRRRSPDVSYAPTRVRLTRLKVLVLRAPREMLVTTGVTTKRSCLLAA